MRSRLGITIAILLLGATAFAQQDSSTATSTGTIVVRLSGKQLYASYCALCHGADGKGGGPFSPN